MHHNALVTWPQCQVLWLKHFYPWTSTYQFPCRGWAAAGVNHKLIFELDPRQHSSYQDILGTSIMLAVIWAISLVVFIFADYLNIPAFYSPLVLMITYAVFLFNPVKILKYEARCWILNVISRIMLAPLPFVVFADFWVNIDWFYFIFMCCLIETTDYFTTIIQVTPSLYFFQLVQINQWSNINKESIIILRLLTSLIPLPQL